MMTEKRKSYTADFKREAVRLVTEHQYGVAETARNLGPQGRQVIREILVHINVVQP